MKGSALFSYAKCAMNSKTGILSHSRNSNVPTCPLSLCTYECNNLIWYMVTK